MTRLTFDLDNSLRTRKYVTVLLWCAGAESLRTITPRIKLFAANLVKRYKKFMLLPDPVSNTANRKSWGTFIKVNQIQGPHWQSYFRSDFGHWLSHQKTLPLDTIILGQNLLSRSMRSPFDLSRSFTVVPWSTCFSPANLVLKTRLKLTENRIPPSSNWGSFIWLTRPETFTCNSNFVSK